MDIHTKFNRIIFFPVLVFIAMVLNACDNTTIYNESDILSEAKWNETDTLFAKFEVSDSTHYHNISLNTRINSLYLNSNIYFKVILTGPIGQHITEIKSFEITDKAGKWLGKGFGDLHSYELPLLYELPLKQFGSYKVKVIPYMRKDVVHGIHDRGIKVSLGKEIF
ncbi:MAG: gliding motility-associated lipoprotein GldH [Bacteroidia bacterium]